MRTFDFDNKELVKKLKEVKNKVGSLSIFRLIVFIAMGASFVLAVSGHPIWFVFFLGTVTGFVILIKKYNAQKDQEAIYKALQEINGSAEKRIKRDLKDLPTGEEFLDKRHPFANDLDLFGDHSLFQMLNHTVSTEGRKKLAERMKADFGRENARNFRSASLELSSKQQFLHAMEGIGKAFYKEEKSVHSWIDWLKTSESASAMLAVFAVIGPVGGITLSLLVYLGTIPAAVLGIWILVGMIFLSMVFKRLKVASDSIPSRNQLKTYRYWLAVLEKEEFTVAALRAAQQPFRMDRVKASGLLDQLDSLGLWIQNRINLIYLPLNLLFWLDLFIYLRVTNWKKKYGEIVAKFPEELIKWEVLVSLGAFEMEVGGRGQVVETDNMLVAKELSHPLLQPEKAVANDFKLGGNEHVILLTGSNMSGKTTFMRTIGINCVLVNLGLSPYAQEFGFGDFQLYTSMRNTDNLGESVSSFYAELSRIKQLIDRIEAGEKIFFLLDEILKGTNTEDRIAGSEALIRQVSGTKAQGIISTHDIELAELESRMEGVHNYSFHSEIHDQRIDFDYKLKSGACPSFNAHKLMELMGIRFQK